MKKMFPFVAFAILFAAMLTNSFAQQQVETMEDPFAGSSMQMPSSGVDGTLLGQWSTGVKLPIPKKYHAVASCNGEIYVFGGVTTGNAYNAKSYKYSPTTSAWTPLPDFPVAKWVAGQAQTINGKIYLTGGLSNMGTSYAVVKDCYEFDPATNAYTKKASMPLAQGFAASGMLGGRMYLIAGCGSVYTTYISTVQTYNPISDTWGVATSYPVGASWVTGTTVGEQIITTGGYNKVNPQMTYIADTYIGQLVGMELQWRKVKDYPIGPTIFISSCGLGNAAYFFGGMPSIDNNAPATQRSFKYEPATDTWTTLELKPTGSQMMTQAGTDGQKIYAPGGEAPTAVLDVLEILDPGAQGGPAAFLSTKTIDKWIKKSVPQSVSVTLKNNGIAELTYTASVDAGSASWLSLDKTSGSVNTMASEGIMLTMNCASVAVGDHQGTITIGTNDPNNPSFTISVTVHVQDQDVDTDMKVYVEEFTGTWCGWCPYGVDSLKALVAQFGEKVNIVSLHSGDAMARTQSDSLMKLLKVTGFPTSSIHRTIFPGQSGMPISRDIWGEKVREILSTKRSPVTITVSDKLYDPKSKTMSLKANVFAHQTLTGSIMLSIIQTEDSLNYEQHIYNKPYTIIYPFYHENVFKQIIPNEIGEQLVSTSVASQTMMTKTFTFKSLDSVAANSRLVFLVHRASGTQLGEIIQTHSEQLLINSTTDAENVQQPGSFSLNQNYPNPFNPSTTFTYSVPNTSRISIIVTDAFGREVRTLVNGTVNAGSYSVAFDGSNIASGSYFVTMRAGSFVQTRTMTLMK